MLLQRVGLIDGRRVAICAYDFTVMAGSMGGAVVGMLVGFVWMKKIIDIEI